MPVDTEHIDRELNGLRPRLANLNLIRVGVYYVIFVVYAALRLPFILDGMPGFYRNNVQTNMMTIAISTAQHGLPRLVEHQSFAGLNLHGILGGPVILAGLDPRFVRLVPFTAGLATLWLVYQIMRRLGLSWVASVGVVGILAITPHFVLYTGEGNPVAMDIVFSTASVYAYLRYLDCARESRRWLVAIGAFAGLATLNHFWGGVAAITIFALEGAVLLRAKADGGLKFAREHAWEKAAPVATVVIVGLLPALALYLYYQQIDPTNHYIKDYFIAASWDLFFDPNWYLKLVGDVRSYLPSMTPRVAIPVLALTWYVARERGRDELAELVDGTYRPTPAGLLLIWLASGLLIFALLPRGALGHDYYFWDVLVPSIALIGYVADPLLLENGVEEIGDGSPVFLSRLAAGFVVFVVITASFSGVGAQVAQANPSADGSLQARAPMHHGADVGAALDGVLEDSDTVYHFGTPGHETAMLMHNRVYPDVYGTTGVTSGPFYTADILLRSQPLDGSLGVKHKYVMVANVSTHGKTTIIYERADGRSAVSAHTAGLRSWGHDPAGRFA
jgi:hypothetical protein